VRRRFVVPVVACITLAAPAAAAAHARSPTVALDYRLVLDDATRTLPGIGVDILDGDRSLRVSARKPLVVLGDLGEPMLRIGPRGTWANRASVTAASQRLATMGHGWVRVGGASFTWHDHRLAPPPYAGGRPGPAARFTIPVRIDERPTVLAGTFVRYRRPAMWPWLLGCGAAVAAVALVVRLRPVVRARLGLFLGAAAGVAALAGLVSFGVADAPTGRVAWAQIVIGFVLAAIIVAALVRFDGEGRTVLAGLVGAAGALTSIGSLDVFRHAVVVSLLPDALARAVAALALSAGAAAVVTVFFADRART